MNEKVLVLGAGLAGLSAAYHLKCEYVIFEKESRAGGLCRSYNDNGFIFDYAPHILYPQDEYIRSFIKKLLHGNLLVQAREAWIYHRAYRAYTRFPFQSHLFGLPVQVVEHCLRELKKAHNKIITSQPRSYYRWILQNFGQGMSKEFLVPYSEKLWTVHPKTMNCAWLKNRVIMPSYSEIIQGARSDTVRQFGLNAKFWYPLHGGIGALPDALIRQKDIGKKLRLDSRVTAIDLRKKTVTVNKHNVYGFSHLISSLPLPEIVALIKDAPGPVRQAADRKSVV
jgi:protoporphyrinogen oxidase